MARNRRGDPRSGQRHRQPGVAVTARNDGRTLPWRVLGRVAHGSQWRDVVLKSRTSTSATFLLYGWDGFRGEIGPLADTSVTIYYQATAY